MGKLVVLRSAASGILYAGLVSTMGSACLVTTDPNFKGPSGLEVDASFMCTICQDRPFCYHPTGTALEFQEPVSGSCPDGWLLSVAASRVADLSLARDPFYCIPVENHVVDAGPILDPADNKICPADEMERGAFEHLHFCADTPRSCRLGPDAAECAPEDLPAPGDPACSDAELNDQGTRRSRCVAIPDDDDGNPDESKALDTAVGKLVKRAGDAHGDSPPQAPPNGAGPQRYCYVSCYRSVGYCEETVTDPPQKRPGSIALAVDPSHANAAVDVQLEGDAYDARLALFGTLYVSLGANCVGPQVGVQTCEAELSWVDVHSDDALQIAGETIRDIQLTNTQPLRHEATDRDGTALMVVPRAAPFFVWGNGSSLGLIGTTYQPSSEILITLDWDAREFHTLAFFEDVAGTSSLQLNLTGDIPNLPPRANAGADQLLECTGSGEAAVTLSALGSSDPDGTADISGYTWTTKTSSVVSSGPTWDVQVPLGSHAFTVYVSDAAGAMSADSMNVTVEDTAAPELQVTVAAGCLWPPNHKAYLFELGDDLLASASDSCDIDPQVRIVSVTSNQPEDGTGDGDTGPDVAFGSDAFCVRAERAGNQQVAREYTVVVEAKDASGNTTQKSLVIQVPHDHHGSNCGTPSTLEEVEIDDARCTLTVEEPDADGGSESVDPNDRHQHVDRPEHLLRISRPSIDPQDGRAAETDMGPGPYSEGCSISSDVPRSTASWGWISLAGVGALVARRRRRDWAREVILVGALVLTSCSRDGASSEVSDRSADQSMECSPGVWLSPASRCVCDGGAVDTPECSASDCETFRVLVLDAESHQSFDAIANYSRSADSLHVVAGPLAVIPSTWTETADGFEQKLEGGETYGDSCTARGQLTRSHGSFYEPAGDRSELTLATMRTAAKERAQLLSAGSKP